MPNPIKYSTSAQTLALKKGNYWIGTGDVGKGPTSTTDYWNGISPPSGGYTIYLNKASNGPAIYTAANDSQLISITNGLAGQTFATAAAALDWYNGQTDKMVFNRDYEAIVTKGLVLNLDAGFTPSYPTTGTTWYNLGVGNNGTLYNGPTFSSSNGGYIIFDGSDDYSQLNFSSNLDEQSMSICFFFKNLSTRDWTDFAGLRNTSSSALVFEKGGNNGEPLTNGYFKVYPLSSTSLTNVHVPGFYILDSNVHFFCLTANSTQWNLYNETGSYASGGVSGSTVYYDAVSIGTDISRLGGSRFSNCNIYSLQIYNRALTAAEVSQNFNALKGRYGL